VSGRALGDGEASADKVVLHVDDDQAADRAHDLHGTRGESIIPFNKIIINRESGPTEFVFPDGLPFFSKSKSN